MTTSVFGGMSLQKESKLRKTMTASLVGRTKTHAACGSHSRAAPPPYFPGAETEGCWDQRHQGSGWVDRHGLGGSVPQPSALCFTSPCGPLFPQQQVKVPCQPSGGKSSTEAKTMLKTESRGEISTKESCLLYLLLSVSKFPLSSVSVWPSWYNLNEKGPRRS